MSFGVQKAMFLSYLRWPKVTKSTPKCHLECKKQRFGSICGLQKWPNRHRNGIFSANSNVSSAEGARAGRTFGAQTARNLFWISSRAAGMPEL